MVCSSETSIDFDRAALLYSPEDRNFHRHVIISSVFICQVYSYLLWMFKNGKM
jgi:hypothetical protein